jgi:hypothetical protein
VIRCCALREKLHLLQLPSPSFFVFHFFLLPAVLIAFEGRSDTLKVPLCLRLLVWLRHAQRLLWLCSTPQLIVEFLLCLPESLQCLLPPDDLLLLLCLLGLVLGCCCCRILLSCLIRLWVLDTDCRTCCCSLRE